MKYRTLSLYNDYPHLEKIWSESKMGVAPPAYILSENGVVVMTDDEVIVGAIFVYYTIGSSLCMIGWPLLDKSVKKDRGLVVDTMYATAEDMASKEGYSVASTWSSLDHVKKRLEENEWVAGDDGLVNYLKKI